MDIKPLSNRVLIKQVEAESKTTGGIYIPDTSKEAPAQGTVVAMGKGRYSESGKLIEPELKVGDSVLYGKYAGTKVKADDNEEYMMMREPDVIALLRR